MNFTSINRISTKVDRKKVVYFLSGVLILALTACKKLVETPVPTDRIPGNAVYTSDPTAISVLNALYGNMNSTTFQGTSTKGSISFFAGLSSDEYTLAPAITDVTLSSYYKNSLIQTNQPPVSGAETWAPLYSFIFRCNAVIEGLNSSQGNALTPTVRQQLWGEAKFLRAFFYFYLVNQFGDVPLALTTDPQANSLLPRSAVSDVYNQMVTDLLDAEEKLNNNYLDATLIKTTQERVRPTKWAANALLARVYLYKGDYANADARATAVINNSSQFTLLPLNGVFLKNSLEAIWQLQPTALNFNTIEAQNLVIPPSGPSLGAFTSNPIYLSKQLLSSFDSSDQRAVLGNWINRTIYNKTSTTKDTVYYPFKYKLNNSDATIIAASGTTNMKEYFMVLRLGEMYLIRAEARAQLGNIQGAKDDLNAIRHRAGLGDTPANDQASLLAAILNERRHELFSEWGNRWFDLKRTHNIDAVMTAVTPIKSNGTVQWQSYKQLYPVPIEALNSSPNITQNAGY